MNRNATFEAEVRVRVGQSAIVDEQKKVISSDDSQIYIWQKQGRSSPPQKLRAH